VDWVDDYIEILRQVYRVCKGNWELIVPAFNLDVYEHDLRVGRGLRRFADA